MPTSTFLAFRACDFPTNSRFTDLSCAMAPVNSGTWLGGRTDRWADGWAGKWMDGWAELADGQQIILCGDLTCRRHCYYIVILYHPQVLTPQSGGQVLEFVAYAPSRVSNYASDHPFDIKRQVCSLSTKLQVSTTLYYTITVCCNRTVHSQHAPLPKLKN